MRPVGPRLSRHSPNAGRPRAHLISRGAQARAHLYQHKELSGSHQIRHLKVTKAGEDGKGMHGVRCVLSTTESSASSAFFPSWAYTCILRFGPERRWKYRRCVLANRGHLNAAPATHTGEGLGATLISGLTPSFSTRYRTLHAWRCRTHARLASGWRADADASAMKSE